MNELKSWEIKWKTLEYINVKEKKNHTSVQAFSSSYSLGLNTLLLLSLHTLSCCDQIYVLICRHSHLVLTFMKKDVSKLYPSAQWIARTDIGDTSESADGTLHCP